MSRVRVAPGTRRSPKTTGLPPVSRSRPWRPRARRAAASHSPVARTRADSWLTEFRRTNSTSPSTIARRRDVRCRSNVAQLVIVTAAVYPNVRSARQIVERRQDVHAHHVKELLDLHVLIGLRHARASVPPRLTIGVGSGRPSACAFARRMPIISWFGSQTLGGL